MWAVSVALHGYECASHSGQPERANHTPIRHGELQHVALTGAGAPVAFRTAPQGVVRIETSRIDAVSNHALFIGVALVSASAAIEAIKVGIDAVVLTTNRVSGAIDAVVDTDLVDATSVSTGPAVLSIVGQVEVAGRAAATVEAFEAWKLAADSRNANRIGARATACKAVVASNSVQANSGVPSKGLAGVHRRRSPRLTPGAHSRRCTCSSMHMPGSQSMSAGANRGVRSRSRPSGVPPSGTHAVHPWGRRCPRRIPGQLRRAVPRAAHAHAGRATIARPGRARRSRGQRHGQSRHSPLRAHARCSRGSPPRPRVRTRCRS